MMASRVFGGIAAGALKGTATENEREIGAYARNGPTMRGDPQVL